MTPFLVPATSIMVEQFKMMKILITGATGLVGSWLLKSLDTYDYEIQRLMSTRKILDEGTLVMRGLQLERVLDAVRIVTIQHERDKRVIAVIKDYLPGSVSKQIVRVVLSYTDYINRTVWSKP